MNLYNYAKDICVYCSSSGQLPLAAVPAVRVGARAAADTRPARPGGRARTHSAYSQVSYSLHLTTFHHLDGMLLLPINL